MIIGVTVHSNSTNKNYEACLVTVKLSETIHTPSWYLFAREVVFFGHI